MWKTLGMGLISLTLVAGCTTPEDGPPTVQIAAQNNSDYDFDALRLHEIDWGGLAAGDRTDFNTVDQAYSYTYIHFEVDGVVFEIQPIDYIGEEALAPGKYTYDLSVEDPDSGQVTVTLVADDSP